MVEAQPAGSTTDICLIATASHGATTIGDWTCTSANGVTAIAFAAILDAHVSVGLAECSALLDSHRIGDGRGV